jgi:hypothetical protein
MEVNKMSQNNMDKDPGTSSVLTISLNPYEMAQLQDSASGLGMEPSDYVRAIIGANLSRKQKSANSEFNPAASGGIALIQLEKDQSDSDIVQSALTALQKTCRCTVINPRDMGYSEVEKLIRENTSL